MEKFKEFRFDNGTINEGLTSELSLFYVLEYFKCHDSSVLLVTSNLYDANKLYQAMETYTDQVFLFPMDDFFTSVALAVSPELKLKRLETLEKVQEKCIVITNLMGYLRMLPQKSVQDSLKITLKKDLEISREDLVSTLENLGYQRDSMVTSTGEYAVRGFVLDVFLIDENHPIRIEFFGDTIESIRYFDEETQRTVSEVSSITCRPVDEVKTEGYSSLLQYMGDATVVYFDYPQIEASYAHLVEESLAYQKEQELDNQKFFLSFDEIHPSYILYVNHVVNDLKSKNVCRFQTNEIDNFKGNFTKLKEVVQGFIYQKKTVVFALSTSNQISEIRDLFEQNVVLVKDGQFHENAINIVHFKINKGFIWDNLVVISEFDIEEIKQEVKYKNNLHIGKKIRDLNALQTGDYVVHRAHGIGI